MKFRTVAGIQSRSKQVLEYETCAVLHLYETKGYNITPVHGDHEFKCIREEIRPTNLNICSKDDHVGEVERSIRTIKERVRCTIHSLPFKKVPRLVCKRVMERAVKISINFQPEMGYLAP